jgi:glycosyltransferase involved in cell wall biosynthesis
MVDAWSETEDTLASFKKAHMLSANVILFGGRLSGMKGGDKMVEALELVMKRVPDAQLLVVGEKDAYATRMLAQAQVRGVEDHVVFTGWLPSARMRAAYGACSLVVLPSLYLEPFGLIALEGMAAKKPVVATCFGGPREIVEDGRTGYIVNPFDVATLGERTAELLIDKEKRARFGKAGFERVAQEFSLSRQAEQYEKLYRASQTVE